jgi:chromate transporter
MGKEAITDWRAIVIAILSGIMVFKYKKINSAIVVAGGALLGFILFQF